MLDVDGVLNSTAWMHSSGTMWGACPGSLDPVSCARLHRVLVATGCDVVLSSAWRYVVSLAEMRGWLAEKGCPGARVIDRTPKASEMGKRVVAIPGHPGHSMYADEVRGHEIQAWLDDRGEGRTFAIVDDDADMAHLAHRLVRTSNDVGIQDEHVERLIEMLGDAAGAARAGGGR